MSLDHKWMITFSMIDGFTRGDIIIYSKIKNKGKELGLILEKDKLALELLNNQLVTQLRAIKWRQNESIKT